MAAAFVAVAIYARTRFADNELPPEATTTFLLSPAALGALPFVASSLLLIAFVCLWLRYVPRIRTLQQRETQLLAVLSKTQLASAIVRDSGEITALEHIGDPDALWFERDDAVGRRLWELPGTQPELTAALEAALSETFESGAGRFTCEHIDRAGAFRHYEIRCSPAGSGASARLAHVLISDCSAEKVREIALARAETFYRRLITHSPDAIACIEYSPPGISPQWSAQQQIDAFFEGTVVVCNDNYAELLGYRRSSQITGRQMKQLVPRTSQAIDFLTRVIESGYDLRGWESELGSTCSDSIEELRLTDCSGEFEGEHLARAWIVYRDVSHILEEVDAVALGAQRRESLRRAQEAYFCFEHDPAIDTLLPVEQQARAILNGRLVECNAAFVAYAGAEEPESLIGRPLSELMGGSVECDDDHMLKRIMHFVENGYALENVRSDAFLPDGRPITTQLNSRGIVRRGRLSYHWGMLLDVTEQETGQRALQHSEARFERMAGHSPALIYRIRMGAEPEFDFVNDAILAISGYSREHAFAEPAAIREVFSPKNLQMLCEQIDGDNSAPVLTRHFHRNEELVYLEHRVVPVRSSSGELSYIEGVALDVTERLSSQRQLQTALEEIRALKDQLQQENVQLRDEIRSVRQFHLIVGNSLSLRQAIELAAKAAPTDATILILGETGTGKELFARSIHKSSARSDRPLVSVNCAALPPTLIESELFGHRRGAFTGANADRIGRFEAADGGTLFLDEIGEMPLDLQSKLLRVVQEGAFERLGDSETIHVDVRLIAATNCNLAAAVERGEFRADLFYRLNVFPIVIPPLRARIEDVPVLANHFAARYSARFNKQFDAISPAFLRQLMNHHWPGNVRELEAVIERSMIVSSNGTLQSVELSSERRPAETRGTDDLERAARVLDRGLQDAERHHILHALRQTDWVIEGPEGAATRLGIAPSTLRSRMKKLGISRPRMLDEVDAPARRRRIH